MQIKNAARIGLFPLTLAGYVYEWLALGFKSGQQWASAHQYALFVQPRIDEIKRRQAEKTRKRHRFG